jgi:hypothetical protein
MDYGNGSSAADWSSSQGRAGQRSLRIIDLETRRCGIEVTQQVGESVSI